MSFRIRAFLIHLLISLVIGGLSFLLVFFIWHPSPLAKAVGVANIFMMMIAIDTILGPLLTLAVAKEEKKSLKFDLSIIACIQFVALVYGLHMISLNRPVYIVFNDDMFDVVQKNAVYSSELEKADIPYDKLPLGRYKYVAVIPAKDNIETYQRIQYSLKEGVSTTTRPSLYEPLETQYDTIHSKLISLAELNKFNDPKKVYDTIKPYNAKGWIPVNSVDVNMVMLVDANNNFTMVDLRPSSTLIFN